MPDEGLADVEPLVADVEPSGWLPDLVLAVDGSYHQLPVENGYPGAELAYVTVASVLLNVKKQRELDRSRPVDPLASRRTEEAGSIDCALPGCNVVIDDESTPKASFRRVFFEAIQNERQLSDGETLLETYEALLAHKPTGRPQQCPYDDCPTAAVYHPAPGASHCTCEQQRPVVLDRRASHPRRAKPDRAERSDVRRGDAGMGADLGCELSPVDRAGTATLSHLANLAIVLDGPLAVFGHPAWLGPAIGRELRRINEAAREVIGRDLLLVGVEKSGAFVDHFETLDTPIRRTNGKARFEPQTAILLTNEYIRDHIAIGNKPFGEDTYFGRKLFYKTASGARIVASLPFLTEDARDLLRGDARHFPRLADAMSLIDVTFSARFPNAVAPLVSAHAEAAIPLNLGREVLERLARSLMAEDEAA